MKATNHTLAGVLLAVAVPKPLIVLPLAFLSHFAMDALPHFADNANWTNRLGHKFKLVLATDCSVAFLVLCLVATTRTANSPLLVASGVLAASPDLMWLPRYINELRHRPNPPMGLLARFHSKIQREYSWGIVLELMWASLGFLLLTRYLPVGN